MSGPPDVLLRPLVVADAVVIAGWAADPTFCRWAGWDPARTPAEVRRHHERVIAHPPSDLLRLGVEAVGELVGYVDLQGTDPRQRELGLVIGGRERWGRGLGTAAAMAAVVHAFDVLGLDRVAAETASTHERSLRVLLRAGFVEVSEPGESCRRLERSRG